MNVADKLYSALVIKTGKSVTDMAREIGIGRPALSNVINGNSALSIELALKLEKMFGLNAKRLLIAQLNEQIEQARQSK